LAIALTRLLVTLLSALARLLLLLARLLSAALLLAGVLFVVFAFVRVLVCQCNLLGVAPANGNVLRFRTFLPLGPQKA
jgi:hypothetical protein